MSYYARFVVGEADVTILIDLDGHPDENLDGAVTMTLGLRRKPWEDDVEINATGDIISAALWTVQFDLTADHLAVDGNYEGYVTVAQLNGAVHKFPVEVDVLPDRGDVSALLS